MAYHTAPPPHTDHTEKKLEEAVKERTRQLDDSLEQLKTTVDSLERSQSRLYRSNRFKELLTSIVLHDIQTPLRFLKNIVRNVQHTHQSLSPAELKQELDELYEATEEVTAYSKDFLLWIKVQKDGFETDNKPVNICDLLQETVRVYQRIAQVAGNTISVTCHDDAVVLNTDPALLAIVVRNLIDNAIKYAPGGKIMVSTKTDEAHIIISVADNGAGMSSGQVAALMGNDNSMAMAGSGKLGYQFIKDMLRVMGGRLIINSQPGAGTTVHLQFINQ